MLGGGEETYLASSLADCRSNEGKSFLGETVRDAKTPAESSEEMEGSYEKWTGLNTDLPSGDWDMEVT